MENTLDIDLDDIEEAVKTLDSLGVVGSDVKAILAIYKIAKALGLTDLMNNLLKIVISRIGNEIIKKGQVAR